MSTDHQRLGLQEQNLALLTECAALLLSRAIKIALLAECVDAGT